MQDDDEDVQDEEDVYIEEQNVQEEDVLEEEDVVEEDVPEYYLVKEGVQDKEVDGAPALHFIDCIAQGE